MTFAQLSVPGGTTISTTNPSTGNVGIGTSSPTQKLSVIGGSIKVGDEANPQYIGRSSDLISGGTSVDLAIRSDNGSLIFGAGGTELARILNSGNLLIGKTTQVNSAYELDIAGSARANEIVVKTTGADFVFEEEYKLHSLQEVESFIKTNIYQT